MSSGRPRLARAAWTRGSRPLWADAAGRGFCVKRKTVSKRLRAKLQAVWAALLRHRHEPLAQQVGWLQGMVRGYYNYHAIPGNMPALETFRREAPTPRGIRWAPCGPTI